MYLGKRLELLLLLLFSNNTHEVPVNPQVAIVTVYRLIAHCQFLKMPLLLSHSTKQAKDQSALHYITDPVQTSAHDNLGIIMILRESRQPRKSQDTVQLPAPRARSQIEDIPLHQI